MAYLAPTVSGRDSSIQQTIASTSWATDGALFGRQIMSPREWSISSARRTVTDMGGNASAIGASAVSIDEIVEVNPLGSTMTSSPGFITPEATWPAYPR